MDAARSSARVNQTPRRVIRTGRDGSTPGNTCIDVSSPRDNSPVMIGGTTVSPSCRLIGSLQVGNKWQSATPDKIRNTQKFDTFVDRKLPDDQDYASIFSKVTVRELSHGSIADLYLRLRMDFASNFVQTKAPHFVDLGLLDVNTLNEFGIQGTPAIKIRSPTDVSHWFAPDHVFGKATAVVMSAARSDQDYIYKTYLTFGGKIRTLGAKTFRWFNHLWTRLFLVWTRPTKQRLNWTQLLLGGKLQNLRQEHDQRNNQSKKLMRTYQWVRSQTHHCQTHHRAIIIRPMTAIT